MGTSHCPPSPPQPPLLHEAGTITRSPQPLLLPGKCPCPLNPRQPVNNVIEQYHLQSACFRLLSQTLAAPVRRRSVCPCACGPHSTFNIVRTQGISMQFVNCSAVHAGTEFFPVNRGAWPLVTLRPEQDLPVGQWVETRTRALSVQIHVMVIRGA